MKVKTNNVSVESYGVSNTGEFRIKASAKAFNILSSQIYTDKPLAIARELICNMYDAHVSRDSMYRRGDATEYMAPIGTPFNVTLPNAFESNIIFRDFGTGLSDNQVETIYTTYFESTKTESDDYIGALGLGSKSPFCYVENFTVTSYYNGVKTVYLMFIGEEGIPKPAVLLKEEVDHTLLENKNGLEICIAVNQRDHYSFKHSVKQVLTYFPPASYNLNNYGTSDLEYYLEKVQPTLREHVYTCDSLNVRDRVTILQGNVTYPVKLSQLGFGDRQGHILQFFKTSYHLFVVPIGTADVAASREEISYDKQTIRNLKIRLLQFYRLVRSDARKSLPPTTMPYWDRLIKYRELHDRGNVYRKVVQDAIYARYGEKGIIRGEGNSPYSMYPDIMNVIPSYFDLTRSKSEGSIYCEGVATKHENSRYYGKTIFYRKKSTRGRSERHHGSFNFISKKLVIIIDDGKVRMIDLHNLMNHFYKTDTHELLLVRSVDTKEPLENKLKIVNDYLQSVENPPVEVITCSELSDRLGKDPKELRTNYEQVTTAKKYYAYIYHDSESSRASFTERFSISDMPQRMNGKTKAVYVILSDGYPEGGLTSFNEKYRAFIACGLGQEYALFGVSKTNLTQMKKVVISLHDFEEVLRVALHRMSSDKLTKHYSLSAFSRSVTKTQIVDHLVPKYRSLRSETLRQLVRHRTTVSGLGSYVSNTDIGALERVARSYGISNLSVDRSIDKFLRCVSEEFPLINILPNTGLSKTDIEEVILYIEAKDEKQEIHSE